MIELRIPQATSKGWIGCPPHGCFDWSFPTSKLRRGRVQGHGDICPTLMAGEPEIYVFEGYDSDIDTPEER